MKLLLHICCAPCLIYPLSSLKSEGVEVKGFFYNPNIHNFSEYALRKNALEEFSKAECLEVTYPEYLPAEYFHAVNLNEDNEKRCSFCWSLRLRQTASLAKEKGFDAFSTTLLVSPYQNHDLLKAIGEDAARSFGILFHYRDFRPGFRQARQEAVKRALYLQKYCGCIYSEIQRYNHRKFCQ